MTITTTSPSLNGRGHAMACLTWSGRVRGAAQAGSSPVPVTASVPAPRYAAGRLKPPGGGLCRGGKASGPTPAVHRPPSGGCHGSRGGKASGLTPAGAKYLADRPAACGMAEGVTGLRVVPQAGLNQACLPHGPITMDQCSGGQELFRAVTSPLVSPSRGWLAGPGALHSSMSTQSGPEDPRQRTAHGGRIRRLSLMGGRVAGMCSGLESLTSGSGIMMSDPYDEYKYSSGGRWA